MSKISAAERLVRFVFQDSHVTVSTRKIHWRAFEPRYNENSKLIEVSVFRRAQMTNENVIDLGLGHVAEMQKREPKFWIECSVANMEDQGLRVEEETSTHELHANILGWPVSEDERLERVKSLVLKLKEDSSVSISGCTR